MITNMADARATRRSTQRMLDACKENWRDQVVFDTRLSGMTKAVAYAMARWIAQIDSGAFLENGDIVVGGTQRALAEMVGCSTKTVHLAITSLIDHGHVALVRRPQTRDDTNLYRIISRTDVPANARRLSAVKSGAAPALA